MTVDQLIELIEYCRERLSAVTGRTPAAGEVLAAVARWEVGNVR